MIVVFLIKDLKSKAFKACLHDQKLPKNLKAIKLGKKGKIKIGHDVHAIEHPTGEHWTYTKGFISQLRNDYEWVTELGVNGFVGSHIVNFGGSI